MLNELPVSVNPLPARYVPAPENCVKTIASVPIVAGLLVCTHPVLAFAVPEYTNTKSPESTSDAVSKSAERVG